MAGVRLTTNTPAHLWLRYTYTEPVKTSIPKAKRGALWYYDNKMCFVAWQECEQDEPGDTLIHTFSCDIFPYCVPVWYYLWGTIGGVPSPSNSAIFKAHMSWPPPPPTACSLMAEYSLTMAPTICAITLTITTQALSPQGKAITLTAPYTLVLV